MSAIQMDPMRGYESQNTSDMDSDGGVSIDSKDAWEEGRKSVRSVQPPAPQQDLEMVPYGEKEEGKLYPPLAPITTTVIQYGTNNPPGTWYETKLFGLEQVRAMGKNLGALNKESALDWLTKISSMPALSKEDIVSLIRECINGDDFEALPGDMQMANARVIGETNTAATLKPKINGIAVSDTPKFKVALVQGLSPSIRISMCPMNVKNVSLKELERLMREAFELQKEAYPSHWGKKKIATVKESICEIKENRDSPYPKRNQAAAANSQNTKKKPSSSSK
ncbi:hypothetical protein UY3_00484 [Chelonia mydas]|uniref:Uncharacterized protein n=1 Tax=Chelonia mydas TaxID=8469 RepID=M7CMB2_CHEMY|nr:hypothetical protein UY3_00484 [Chelonia mydas]